MKFSFKCSCKLENTRKFRILYLFIVRSENGEEIKKNVKIISIVVQTHISSWQSYRHVIQLLALQHTFRQFNNATERK